MKLWVFQLIAFTVFLFTLFNISIFIHATNKSILRYSFFPIHGEYYTQQQEQPFIRLQEHIAAAAGAEVFWFPTGYCRKFEYTAIHFNL